MILKAGYRFSVIRISRHLVLKCSMPGQIERALHRVEKNESNEPQNHADNIRKLKNRDVPQEFVGNPRILSNRPQIYTQDHIPQTGQNVYETDLNLLAEAYRDYLETCFSYGFFDATWNFFINTGFDGRRIHQLDLGELCFDLGKLRQTIINEEYTSQHTFRDQMNEKEKEKFGKVVQSFSIYQIEKIWGSALED